jgi:uncharacterized membrane protein YccC
MNGLDALVIAVVIGLLVAVLGFDVWAKRWSAEGRRADRAERRRLMREIRRQP